MVVLDQVLIVQMAAMVPLAETPLSLTTELGVYLMTR